MKYKVLVIEHCEREIEVEADSEEEVHDKALEIYEAGLDMSEGDCNVDFDIIKE